MPIHPGAIRSMPARTVPIFIIALLSGVSCTAQLSVAYLSTEHRTNPTGIGSPTPRFSWQLVSSKRSVTQSAYEIHVSVGNIIIWNSGKISSDSSIDLLYKGTPLKSITRYAWQVKVWDNNHDISPWASGFFTTGLLSPSDWKARWIGPAYTEDSIERPSPILRKSFTVHKKLLAAIACISAHGLYEAQLNGQRIGNAYLTPGWTSYNHRVQYQVYDVTSQIKQGKNAIGATLGSGWYRGYMAYEGHHNIYGKDIALLCQLLLQYADGTTEIIVTDTSWRSTTGAIRSAEIYDGEVIDARLDKPGWSMPEYNDQQWSGVHLIDSSTSNLVATVNEPVVKHESFHPVRILTTPNGERVLDFGQNLVGWIIVKASGKAGDSIALTHAEVLDKHGNFYTANLRAAKARDVFILSGKGVETFEPHFTWHGFRYVKLDNYPGELLPDNFTAVTLYSDLEPTGTFSCSEPLINQLQHNIEWGLKGNFLDVPTDCPQRDERLGWTGDAQVFSRTASFIRNVDNFFAKWLQDVSADQVNGTVPFVIPNVLGDPTSSAGWADVATIVPWNMYLAYGDKKLLNDQYPGMKAYVESIRRRTTNDLWQTGFHFGDWLFYRPEDDNDGRAAVTDKYLIAQCFYAHSTQLLINAANVLNNPTDAAEYTTLLQKIKAAFVKEYMTPGGRLVSSTQTAYVLALQFDMLPGSLRQQAAQRLVDNIASYNNHLTTGFLGTPYICHVLTQFGYTGVAYKLLMQDTYPSWLYPVKMGATTIWERWDGIKPDSSFQTPGMNSFNHYAYGAIGDWMYRTIAGIDTYEDGPGYKHIRIMPHTGGGLQYVNADLKTNYGLVSVHWKTDHQKFIVDVDIPPNTTASAFLPASGAAAVTESGKSLTSSPDVKTGIAANGWVELRMASGKYHFEVTQP